MLVGVEGLPKLGLKDLTDILQEWKFATKPDGTAHSTRTLILQHKAALSFD